MRLGYRFLTFAILVLLALPAPSSATALLEFSADPDGTSCEIADPGPGGLVTVFVLLRYAQGAAGVIFTAPVPPASGLTHISDSSTYLMIGNLATGLAVGFGTCKTGTTILVATLQFVRTSPGEACTVYLPQPGATYSDCQFADMPLNFTDGVVLNSNGQCNPVPFRNPSPLDGATDVPLTADLNWDDPYYVCNAPLRSTATGTVYFGTTTNPPYNESATATHSVGPLAPGTTYYWKVYGDYPYIFSPLWSFTTTNSVAVTPSTWGSIKALYR